MIYFKDLVPNGYYLCNGSYFRMDMRMMWAFCGGTKPYVLETIDPIPLTEDILVKCGFEDLFGEYTPMYFKDRLLVEWAFGDIATRLRVGDENSYWIKDVKYLHEIQNLYFAIEQKELTINL